MIYSRDIKRNEIVQHDSHELLILMMMEQEKDKHTMKHYLNNLPYVF